MQGISDKNQVKCVHVVHACICMRVFVCTSLYLGQGRANLWCWIPVATKLCKMGIREKDQQDAHFFSLICSN